MHRSTKIATCCYCGTRAVLELATFDRGARHELACSGCGAPLHDMKWLRPPQSRPDDHVLVRPTRPARPTRKRPKIKKRKRKSAVRRFGKAMEEIFDTIEDIFD